MKTCFINAGIGYWYPKGSDRLKGTLLDKGFPGDLLFWKDWPCGGYDKGCIYNCKAAAFEEAINRGYTTIIWGDCSVTAVRSTTKFVERVRHGRWLAQSGHNCAQVCTDHQLEYFGITRDEAEKMPDCASGLFGVDTGNLTSLKLIHRWIQAARDGMFNGSRFHSSHESKDPRFLYGRQDQSCLSVIAGQLGIKLDTFIEFAKFKWDRDAGQTFHLEGM